MPTAGSHAERPDCSARFRYARPPVQIWLFGTDCAAVAGDCRPGRAGQASTADLWPPKTINVCASITPQKNSNTGSRCLHPLRPGTSRQDKNRTQFTCLLMIRVAWQQAVTVKGKLACI